jgi:hypothetical protein
VNTVAVGVEHGLKLWPDALGPGDGGLEPSPLLILGVHASTLPHDKVASQVTMALGYDALVIDRELLIEHHVLVPSDNEFQAEARLRQAVWRERRGLPIGEHRGRPLGSRLAMPYAKDTLANYVTDTIRDVVRAEVLDPKKAEGKLYREPRIFDDLLSSQPLCFNLFGEMQRDLYVASRVFAVLMDDPSLKVTNIEFEHSPGRGDLRFTGDHSAFDVFVLYTTETAKKAFLGIEVKYVESLGGAPARHRPRYDEVADAMGVFLPEARARLRQPPLEQFWRDHLLAGSLLLDGASGFDTGAFTVVYPEGNTVVAEAVAGYGACLRDTSKFRTWTLERVLDAADGAGARAWAGEVRERYAARAFR